MTALITQNRQWLTIPIQGVRFSQVFFSLHLSHWPYLMEHASLVISAVVERTEVDQKEVRHPVHLLSCKYENSVKAF